MDNILEDKLQRKLQLINLLTTSEEKQTIDSLSTKLDISKPTIQRDIDYLNKHFNNHFSITLESNEYYIDQMNKDEMTYLQFLIIKDSLNLKLLTTFLLHPFEKIKFYSSKLQISSSNIYKMIKHINTSLDAYQIEIKNVNSKYFLNAHSEITLRRLFSICLIEINYYQIDNFEESVEVMAIIDKLDNNLFNDMSLIRTYYTAFIYLSHLRETQGFHLENGLIKKESDYDPTQIIIDSLTTSPFLNDPMFYSRRLYRLKEFLDATIPDSQKSEILYVLILHIYHNECSDQVPCSIFISRLNNFYSSLVKKEYLNQPVEEIITIFSNILNLDLKEYKVFLSYFLVVYFPEILGKRQKPTVFVYSKLSTSHAYFLQKILTRQFENFYEFIIVKDHFFILENQNNHLFVTNDGYFKSENNFIINDYPKKIDLINLGNKLTQFHQAKLTQ
ncbi:helix-turn-helix domain-containing protein [Vagococcus sp. DIV0080]|uniref:Helix-turn-helix domain-containing protein n=1 Tax=Candidatus Vagococcus giribetii TaxID=2230876 RepID=A0ABS3HQV7_9ENTE|nr:helix-turn-helix domain-containing protein [Vagococcus sp. DIV0080]MBO0476104.1 helix-turn-helix domain-containing protein [Vagococcus sp. DIV0080]